MAVHNAAEIVEGDGRDGFVVLQSVKETSAFLLISVQTNKTAKNIDKSAKKRYTKKVWKNNFSRRLYQWIRTK